LEEINQEEYQSDGNPDQQKMEPESGGSKIITDRKKNIQNGHHSDDEVVIDASNFS